MFAKCYVDDCRRLEKPHGTVMCPALLECCTAQVAKSLLDTASHQSKAQSPATPAVSLEGDSLLQSIGQLLLFRCGAACRHSP